MENDLIRRIVGGESELFEELVLRYQNLVFTVCLNIVRDRQDAENMAQEAFLAAFLALRTYGGQNFKTWLCRIAVNKSIDCKRKRDRAYRYEDAFEEAEAEPSGGPGVEDWLAERERSEKLHRAMAAIPEKYSSVLRERYYGSLPVKEIARRREVPEKTVETWLYRAKKLIRERWGDDDG